MVDDIREWLSDNLRYILLGLAVILIVVIGFCVVRLVTGSSKSSSSGSTAETASTELVTEASTEGTTEAGGTVQAGTDTTAQAGTTAATTSDLTKDDAAILTLIKKYYTAAAAKDVTTLEGIVSPWNDTVKESILQNDVIENYNNISTYSKKGPVDGSYVVYTYYEGKVTNIDTLVPSLSMLYLTTDATGNLIVSDRNESQEVSDYIASVSADSDVQALIADVDKQCKSAQEADPALKTFMNTLDTSEQQTGSDAGATETGEMVSLGDLNVRQEASTDSAIMAVVPTGTTVTKLQDAEDGWCQISYVTSSGTIEGYVKSEYLTAATSDSTGTADSTTTGTADATAAADSTTTGSADTTATAANTTGDTAA